jgi:hypothetical protein
MNKIKSARVQTQLSEGMQLAGCSDSGPIGGLKVHPLPFAAADEKQSYCTEIG